MTCLLISFEAKIMFKQSIQRNLPLLLPFSDNFFAALHQFSLFGF